MAHFFSIQRVTDKVRREWLSSTRGSTRTEVCPPAAFSTAPALWQLWLSSAWQRLRPSQDSDAGDLDLLSGLRPVKKEFMDALRDIQAYVAAQNREQIEQARSLRELWYLRAELFQVVALFRGEQEAQKRIDRLNRYFPVKVSQSSRHLH